MSETVRIQLDDRPCEAEKGETLLGVARRNGIDIPTLCFHPALKPSGSCKLCAVEVVRRTGGKSAVMLSCVLRVKEGMVVRTRGEVVQKARTRAFKNLLRMAPQSKRLIEMAKRYGVDPGPPPDGCIRCRLCIRVCKEIVGPGALEMDKRDGQSVVVPVEGLCIGCGTCVNICPTEVIRIEDREEVRTISIRDEVIGRHPLERCEGCGRRFATPKFLDHIHQRTSTHADVKIHHRYCPTCTKLFSDRIQSMRDRARK